MNNLPPPTDAIAAVTHPDPYPWYADLRAGPPLIFDERLKLWVASRASVVHEVLASDAMRVRPPAEPVPRVIAGTPAGEVFGHLVRMNDGARHEVRKPALQRALAGLDLGDAHAAARRIAARMPGASLAQTCLAFPVSAVAHLFGFPEQELPQVATWMQDFVLCLSPLSTTAQLQAASTAAVALMDRFEQLAAARPAGHASLLRALQAETSADTSRAALANMAGLLSQTCEATAGLLGNSLVALAREPAMHARLAENPSLLHPFVEEVARHDPSIQNTRRFVERPVTVAGVDLAPGDAVLLALGAASRDPMLNPSPDSFDLTRARRQAPGFGHGAHACPGQALAGAIAAAGLESLLDAGLDTRMLMKRGWDYRPSANARIPVFHTA